ncbi:MAG TPA: pantetheine-phosphate adenylyltransferase [Candidatus Acidoferrum sp.]|nr:pantetheine-phosphate adenylyltransferase [Candidatus Acidoferrum sp.]
MKLAVCAGSFNPVTLGHLDLFERTAEVFDEVVVLLVYNSAKQFDVPVEERLALLKKATAHIPNIRVEAHAGLLINYALAHGNAVIVKGLRNEADFAGEMTMAHANHAGSGGLVGTLFMPTRPELTYVSSTIAREFAGYGGDLSKLVPECVREDVAKLYYKGEWPK